MRRLLLLSALLAWLLTPWLAFANCRVIMINHRTCQVCELGGGNITIDCR